jgi:hypothetical protein
VETSETGSSASEMGASLTSQLNQQFAEIQDKYSDWEAIRVEYDSLIYEAQERCIADAGGVIIAEEFFEDVTYILVRDKNEVRLVAASPETSHYQALCGPYQDGVWLAPPSHLAKLLQLADEGIDSFRKKIQRARRVKNECPGLEVEIEIWLFKSFDQSTELRCEAGHGEKLLHKLCLQSFGNFSQFLDNDKPPGSPVQHCCDPSKVNSGESYVVAVDVPCEHQTKLYDNTRCIVYNAPEKKYRMWSWGYTRSTCKSLISCGPGQQFHKPDQPLLEWIKTHGGFKNIAHNVVTTLTRRQTETYFVHTVLVKIQNAELWQQLLSMRTNGNTGPLRCSKSGFIEAGGREATVIDNLQLDTEDGKAYYEIWRNRKDAKRLRKKGDEHQCCEQQTCSDTYEPKRIDKLALELKECQRRLAECKSDAENDFALRHKHGGVFMSPDCWAIFTERMIHSCTQANQRV